MLNIADILKNAQSTQNGVDSSPITIPKKTVAPPKTTSFTSPVANILTEASRQQTISGANELIKSFVQPTVRGVSNLGQSVITPGSSKVTPDQFTSKVYGTDKPFSFTSETAPILGAVGVKPGTNLSNILSPAVGALFTLSDAIPGGEGLRAFISKIAKTNNVVEIGKELIKIGVEDHKVESLSKYLSNINDEQTIRDALGGALAKEEKATTQKSQLGSLQKNTSTQKSQELSPSTSQTKSSGSKVGSLLGTVPQDFNPDKYVQDQVAKREAARVAETPGVLSKAKSFLAEAKAKLVDSTAPIEDVLYDATKKNNIKLLPSEDIHNQIDRVLRAPTLAGQFAKDKGMVKLIEKVPNVEYLDQYLIAKHALELESKGIKTGRDLVKDRKLVEASQDYEKYAKVVNLYSRELLNYSVDSGLISKELATSLKAKYPDYVPFSRIFNELEKQSPNVGGKGVASLGNQTAVQKIVGSEREIESPIRSLLAKTNDVFKQGEKNLAGKMLAGYEKLPGNPFQLTPITTTENVNKRIELFSEAKDFKPLQDKAENIIRSQKKELRQLQSELNGLNKQGVKMATGNKAPESLPTLTSKTNIRIKPEELIDNAPKNFDGLTNSYSTKNVLKKEFGSFDTMKFELKEGGWSILNDLGLTDKQAESVSKQIFKEPEFMPSSMDISQIPAVLTNKDTKRYIDQLISKPNIDLESVKRKIGNREPKVSALISEIEKMRDEYQGVKEIRGDLRNEAHLLRDAESRGKSTITFFDNGVKNIYETTPEVANAAKSLNVQQLGVIGRILALPVRVARLGITGINAPFVAANITKDQVSAFINSKNALRTSIANPNNFVRSLFSAVAHDDLYQEMVRAGGAGTSFDISRNQAEATVESIRSGRNVASKVLYTVKNPSELIRAVENVIARSEELTRIQQYRGTKLASLSKGLPEKEAVIEGARAARESTVNFARRGEWGTVLNSSILYLNASIQATRTLLRNLKERPGATSAKIAISAMTPVAIATSWNLSDPKRKEAYMDIPEYEKENNIIIIPPNPTKDEHGKWNVIKIPLSQEINNLVGMVRKPLEQAHGLDPVKFKDIANALIGTVSPIKPELRSLESTLTPQILKPTLEGSINKTIFTGNPIVPRGLENLSPENQVKKDTSGSARIIGNKIGVSPLKVEAWIKSTFGGVGAQAENAVDTALAKLGKIPKEQIGGQGILEGITARFQKAQGGQMESNAYTTLDQAAQAKTDYKAKNIRPIYDQAQKLIEEGKQREANVLVTKLSPQDRKIYTDIKTSEKAKRTQQLEIELTPLVVKASKLISEGKKDEANKLVKGLTKEEQHAYTLVKKKLNK